jgi:transcriptional regulator with XRE-family HTH domain
MPNVDAALRAQRPEFAAPQGDSLGAQLRRRRRELGHRRVDAAQLIGTSCTSLNWWERDEREPLDRFWPAIIRYLGREPWPEPQSLGERLSAERRRRGLAIFEAAQLMGVDEGTWWWWESGQRTPRHLRTKALVAQFLSNSSPAALDRFWL